ncbi:MAG: ketoacyl-ACP synthase III [Spirochaetales bacterium]|nr:ketoacyl-ACP synthase III [Spirochaetales bacterium]
MKLETKLDKMTGSDKLYPKARPLLLKRNSRILGTGSGVPDEVITNQDIIDEFGLLATDRAVQFSLGISERRRGPHTEKVSYYLTRAAKESLSRAGILPEKIDRIIYSRLFGEHLIPANSLEVIKRLGLKTGIPVMDISAACSGFMHALELGLACINTGDDYVLILGGDRSAISSQAAVSIDTRTIFLNGDGFAAALLGPSDENNFKASYFYTDSSIGDFATIPFGSALLNSSENLEDNMFNLDMPNGQNIHKSVLDSCRIISNRLFDASGLSIDDIDFFITSDQTAHVWRDQVKLLGLTEDQSVSCFHKYGNTVAAMAPLNLHEAIITDKLKRGMQVLMMAHGAGASGGGFIFTY